MRIVVAAAATLVLAALAAPPAAAETVPVAPNGLRIVEVGLDYVQLSFVDRSTNEDGFDIERRQLPNGAFTAVGSIRDHRTGQPEATGWTYGPRPPWGSSGFFCYRVKAFNEAGAGASVEVCPPRPNLAVTSLTLTPALPDPFEPFLVTWRACNRGGAPTGAFIDVAQLDDEDSWQRSVSSLMPGLCYTRTVSHPGLAAGFHFWRVRVDADDRVYESSNSDNTKVVTF